MSRNQFFAAAFSLAFVSGPACARRVADEREDIGALPVASIASGVKALSPNGTFEIKSAQVSVYCTVYVLECASTGERVSVEVSTRGVARNCPAPGAAVTASAVNTGIVLFAGIEAFAYVPNALGRALLHPQRMAA